MNYENHSKSPTKTAHLEFASLSLHPLGSTLWMDEEVTASISNQKDKGNQSANKNRQLHHATLNHLIKLKKRRWQQHQIETCTDHNDIEMQLDHALHHWFAFQFNQNDEFLHFFRSFACILFAPLVILVLVSHSFNSMFPRIAHGLVRIHFEWQPLFVVYRD